MKHFTYLLAGLLLTAITFTSCGNRRPALTENDCKEISAKMKEAIAESLVSYDSTITSQDINSVVMTLPGNGGATVTVDSITPERPITVNVTLPSDESFDYELLVPIFAIILGLLLPAATVILIVWLCLHNAAERRKGRERLIAMSIDKGVQLPDDFFTSGISPKSRLQSGLVWLMWGIGLFIVLTAIGNLKAGSIASIPFLVGIAKLITYFVEDRKSANTEITDGQSDE